MKDYIIVGFTWFDNRIVAALAYDLNFKSEYVVDMGFKDFFKENNVLNFKYMGEGRLRSTIKGLHFKNYAITEFTSYYTTYGTDEVYLESEIISKTLGISREEAVFNLCHSIATQKVYSLQAKAFDLAKKYYTEMASVDTDIKIIADNAGFTIGDITKIKDRLFKGSFNPDYEILKCWDEMLGNRLQTRHRGLLKHLLMEAESVEEGIDIVEAHVIAEVFYHFLR